MKVNRIIILALLFSLLFFIGSVNASEDIGFNQTADTLLADLNLSSLESNFDDNIIEESSNEIIVNDWEDLQYYCSLNDKDYTLKLKENANYYPSDVSDSNGQIIVKNNVKIIGSGGAYIGDVSPQARNIGYTAIKVADDSGIGITLENVTFKWIGTNYQSDGVFLVMGGNANNYISNCYFTNISTNIGHSSILHIKKGNAILTNCTFINCTTDFGCVSVYNPDDDPTKLCTRASMEVNDCYFEGNYARTEPGCINNCGILVVNNTTFYKNGAFWWAGAIHTHGGANTTIYDSDFIDNLAGWNGGALYTYSYLQIYNSRFIGNNCTTNNGGGAIGACKYLHSPYLHIEDCLFQNNENLCWGLDEWSTSGTGRGGAISLMDDGLLELYNNIFIKNCASIGSAVCAISGGLSYGSPDVKIVGNQFINHTRAGDVLDVRVATGSIAEIRDNFFVNNSIVFEKLKLSADDPINGSVTFHLDVALKNPKYYDEDILEKSSYHVYVNGAYHSTVSSQDFTLDLEKGNTAYVYVVPSISSSKSNEIFAGIAKTFIYVSQSQGNDNNSGLSRSQPVKTLSRSIELARSYENIVIMDGTFGETNLTIDYNLTMIAENGATITVTGSAFTIADGDVRFVNVSFKNSKGPSTKNRLISQTGTGFLLLEGCIFQSNEYKIHIEANGAIEGENLMVTGNKDGSFIKCDSIKLKSSVFTDNIATYTLYKAILYSTKTVKFEVENVTFIGNTVHSGCISIKGSGTVDSSSFIGNKMTTSNGRASAIVLEDGSLVVQSSKFINNKDTGKYSSVIYLTSGTLLIKDSILINNIYENTNGLIINGGETSLKKLIANNNWWGNTPDNLNKPALKVYSPSNQLPNGWDPASYWLVLNATSLSEEIEMNNKAPVQFKFTQIDNYGNVSAYDSYYLPSFDLELTVVNGNCDDRKVIVENGLANTYFTLTSPSGGSLKGSFNGISATIDFRFIKSTPDITIKVNDTTFRSPAEIEVILDSSVTGDLIVKVGNVTQIKHINDSTTFMIPDLPVGNYTVEVNYTGNDIYYSAVKTSNFTVNKCQSDINISCGEIVLFNDVIFNFNISEGATGVVEVYVNNQKETINVGDVYTIRNITRGNYYVRAVYKGDGNYLESSDEFKFEVGKSIPSINVNVSDITYGNDAVITVTLDNDATGNVSVVIDGKLNTMELNNGQAILTISKLNAGQNKLVNVSYTGDNKYKEAKTTKLFNIEKAILDFTINSKDIKIGMEETIEITLPALSGGTVTLTGIKSEVKNVPLSGIVKFTYGDLENGSYTVFAEYNGDNYQTLSKSTSFTVALWDEPQWANEGGDIKHTGKSPYASSVNGELKWSSDVANITGNMAIDSEGNIYVTTKECIYSFYNNGTLRWSYFNDAAGVYFSGISIGRDVIISPKADDTLYFINQTTGERYGHANLYQGSSYFAPVVDSNANIYISGQGDANNPNLIIIPYKLWENGGNPIVVSLGNAHPSASPTIIDDTFVVVPCSDAIYVVDISSKTIVYSKSGNINVSSVVGDGNIIYSIFGDSIVAFSLSGSNVWTTKVTGGVGNQLAIDIEQGIYAVNSNGTLYRYDLIDGSELKFTNLTVTSGILVGSESNVYFASDNIFYALDSDGNILWSSKLDSNIIGNPIMDKDGTIYVNGINKVYALGQSSLKNPNLVVGAENIYTNQTETITVTLNENATGLVEITINDTKYQETIVNGKIIKSLDGLIAGDYHVDVRYLGDLRFAQATKSAHFTVLKSDPNMNVTVKNINVGDTAIFYIELNPDATGIVSINIDGKFNSSNLIEGTAKIAINGLTSGIKVAAIEYIGDAKYSSKNGSCIISVNKLDAPISVNVDDVDYGLPIDLEIILPEGASGTVKLILGENTLTEALVNSKATFLIPDLNVGEYNVNVVYEGDGKFNENSTTHKFKVNKADAKFTSVIPEVRYGDVAVITINFLSNETGNVVITLDNQNYTGTIVNSKATVSIDNLAVDNYSILITYSGDKNHNGSKTNAMLTVDPLDSSFNIKYGVQYSVYAVDYNAGERGATLKFKLLDSNNKPISGVSVKVDYGNSVYYKTTDSQGLISFVVNTQVAGTYKSSLYFAGNDKYKSDLVSFSVKVNKKPITITAKAKTFKVKVKTKKYVITLKTKKCSSSNGKIYLKSGKKVTLKVKGKTYTAKINAKGQATFKITKLTKKGKFTATIKFNGDSTYSSVTKKVKITIK